jgi:uncharacterized protein YndB with AHSA1/START domain
MRPTSITATDQILVPASPAAVWRVLADLNRYSAWWPKPVGIRATTITPELEGSDLEVRPRGGPAFHWLVERAVPDSLLLLRYHTGPYQGTGTWLLEPVLEGTRVVYALDLTTTHPLLRLIGRVTNLGRAHSRMMRPVLDRLRHAVTGGHDHPPFPGRKQRAGRQMSEPW